MKKRKTLFSIYKEIVLRFEICRLHHFRLCIKEKNEKRVILLFSDKSQGRYNKKSQH